MKKLLNILNFAAGPKQKCAFQDTLWRRPATACVSKTFPLTFEIEIYVAILHADIFVLQTPWSSRSYLSSPVLSTWHARLSGPLNVGPMNRAVGCWCMNIWNLQFAAMKNHGKRLPDRPIGERWLIWFSKILDWYWYGSSTNIILYGSSIIQWLDINKI